MKIEGTGSNFPIKPENLRAQANLFKGAPSAGDIFQKSGDNKLFDLIKQAKTFLTNQPAVRGASASKGSGKGAPVSGGCGKGHCGKGTPPAQPVTPPATPPVNNDKPVS